MSRKQNKKTPVRHVIIDADQSLRRIDNFLLGTLKGLPKTRIYQMLRRGEIRVNGGRVKQVYRLQIGDKVRIPPIFNGDLPYTSAPHDYLLDMVSECIIFENEHILVLNKPAGIVVHSGSGRTFGIIEILRFLRPSEPGLQLVHRLDQGTSGCLLISKNTKILRKLHTALKAGDIKKQYIALLKGQMEQSHIEVERPVRKSALRSGKRQVEINAQGKFALTRFKLEKKYKTASLVRVKLKTGRTHQIRVHAKSLQHPVAGDQKYGDKEFNKLIRQGGLKRMFLHASSLHLPVLNGYDELEIHAPLPVELSNFLENYE